MTPRSTRPVTNGTTTGDGEYKFLDRQQERLVNRTPLVPDVRIREASQFDDFASHLRRLPALSE